jgi:hypothetical protein
MKTILVFLIVAIAISSYGNNDHSNNKNNNQKDRAMTIDNTKLYGFNRGFLKKHTIVVELKNSNSAISLVPSWQARVMTS